MKNTPEEINDALKQVVGACDNFVEQLKLIGVTVKNEDGSHKDFLEIMEEVAQKFGGL